MVPHSSPLELKEPATVLDREGNILYSVERLQSLGETHDLPELGHAFWKTLSRMLWGLVLLLAVPTVVLTGFAVFGLLIFGFIAFGLIQFTLRSLK